MNTFSKDSWSGYDNCAGSQDPVRLDIETLPMSQAVPNSVALVQPVLSRLITAKVLIAFIEDRLAGAFIECFAQLIHSVGYQSSLLSLNRRISLFNIAS